jgi:hypothetical protein
MEFSYLYLLKSNLLHALKYPIAVRSVNPISKDIYHCTNCGYILLIKRVINYTIREDVTVSECFSFKICTSK